MSIYINGIDIPTRGNPITVLIYPDGTATWEARNKTGTAVQVNPHGRLIDADVLLESFDTEYNDCGWWYEARVDDAPTIIPATDKQEGGGSGR